MCHLPAFLNGILEEFDIQHESVSGDRLDLLGYITELSARSIREDDFSLWAADITASISLLSEPEAMALTPSACRCVA